MTPFDPVALVAMLRAFYPIVGRAALRRARSERAEYFAGGVLIGSSQTHLQLGDGRIFDLIANEGAPQGQTAWQAIDVTTGGEEDDDPFALEEGPLTPIDESVDYFPTDPGRSFSGIVAEGLSTLEGAEEMLDRSAQRVIEADGSADLAQAYAEHIDPAADAHAEIRAALDGDNPIALLEATNGHDPEIDAAREAYVEEPPPDLEEPDPGTPPGDGGGDEPPPAA